MVIHRPDGALPRMLGGRPCLDFANTVDPRHAEQRHDYLPDATALLAWAHRAGTVTDDAHARLGERADADPREARRVHARALALREAIYLACTRDDPAARDVISRELAAALAGVRLEPRATRRAEADPAPGPGTRQRRAAPDRPAPVAWQLPDDTVASVLGPIAVDAGELLRSPELAAVRECPGSDGCGWLFLDESRNGSRRWCSMRVCGNRDKVRRHVARGASAPPGGERR